MILLLSYDTSADIISLCLFFFYYYYISVGGNEIYEMRSAKRRQLYISANKTYPSKLRIKNTLYNTVSHALLDYIVSIYVS